MTTLLASDSHRAALCILSYDKARVPDIALGDRTLPRIFFDRDQDGMPVLTCEGTRPNFVGDWRTDLDQIDFAIDATCDPVPHGWGNAVLGVMFRILAKFDDPSLVISFNGHSMGGSCALIGAWLWKLAGRKLGRVTAFEPGRVGKLSGMLADEDVLITRVGDGMLGDPVTQESPLRDHPEGVDVAILPRQPDWNPFECHKMVNVQAALAAALKGAA